MRMLFVEPKCLEQWLDRVKITDTRKFTERADYKIIQEIIGGNRQREEAIRKGKELGLSKMSEEALCHLLLIYFLLSQDDLPLIKKWGPVAVGGGRLYTVIVFEGTGISVLPTSNGDLSNFINDWRGEIGEILKSRLLMDEVKNLKESIEDSYLEISKYNFYDYSEKIALKDLQLPVISLDYANSPYSLEIIDMATDVAVKIVGFIDERESCYKVDLEVNTLLSFKSLLRGAINETNSSIIINNHLDEDFIKDSISFNPCLVDKGSSVHERVESKYGFSVVDCVDSFRQDLKKERAHYDLQVILANSNTFSFFKKDAELNVRVRPTLIYDQYTFSNGKNVENENNIFLLRPSHLSEGGLVGIKNLFWLSDTGVGYYFADYIVKENNNLFANITYRYGDYQREIKGALLRDYLILDQN